MSCENVQELISPLLDWNISASERESVLEHTRVCRKCAGHLEQMQELRAGLRTMQAPVPSELASELRVLASHERARHVARISLRSRWQEWSGSLQLWFDNLMRPVALPAAGGLFSTMVLFSLLLPSLSFSHNFFDRAFLTSPAGEVIALSSNGTYAPSSYGDILTIVPANLDSSNYANVVWLTINENGKVIDYAVERGSLTPDLQSIILFSQFTPATVLGLPTSGRVRVAQRDSDTMPPRRNLRG
jgi:hypothetical protein